MRPKTKNNRNKVRNPHKRTSRNRLNKQKGKGLEDEDLELLLKFKEFINTNKINLDTMLMDGSKLSNAFSEYSEEPLIKKVEKYLKKNLINNITINEIINETYKIKQLQDTKTEDFDELPIIIDDLNLLITTIIPGKSYVWNNFLFRFYNFKDIRHKKYKEQILESGSLEYACRGEIAVNYITKVFEQCDYFITVSDYRLFLVDKNTTFSNIYAFTMNNVINYSNVDTIDTYTSTTCSREMVDEEGNTIISFGLMIRYMILNYLKTIGITHAYNDASNKKLIPYYSRWNYRLGTEKCNGEPDEITIQHEQLLNTGNKDELEMFYNKITDAGYKTSSGYRMKLCNINLNGWKEYLIKSLSGIKDRLDVNQIIYVYYNDYIEKQKIKEEQLILKDEYFELKNKPLEIQRNNIMALINKATGVFTSTDLYDLVVTYAAKNGLINLTELTDKTLMFLNKEVMKGAYNRSMKNILINKIKQKENII